MGHILWLASYPKSGNTWLRIFLRNLTDPRKAADINGLGAHFPYDVGASWYHRLDPRPPQAYTRREVVAMRPRVQALIAESDPRITLVKTHSALVIEDGHHAINPEVTIGAVYLVRNPLDVAVSFSFHSGRSFDAMIDMMNMKGAATEADDASVSEHIGSWSENVKSWTREAKPNIHVVRYEDMVVRPVKTFTGIASFLGLNPSRSALERALRLSSMRVLQEQERKRGFVERLSTASAPFFRQGRPGDGVRLLKTEQIDRLVAAHHEQMGRFDYLP
jgi:hypothetical protein